MVNGKAWKKSGKMLFLKEKRLKLIFKSFMIQIVKDQKDFYWNIKLVMNQLFK